MFTRAASAVVLVLMLNLASAQEPAPPKPLPQLKLDFGRPVEVAKFSVTAAFSVFPVALEFSDNQVYLVYMAGRRTQNPKLIYQRSPDRGRTWDPPVVLADSSMANACRDGDVLWIIATSGDTAGFLRYGTAVRVLRLDLKTGKVGEPRTILGEVAPGQKEHSFGMVSIAARGQRLAAAIIEDHRRDPDLKPGDPALAPRLLLSADAGATWQESPLGNIPLGGNSSVAFWPMLRSDGVTAVLATVNDVTHQDDMTQIELDDRENTKPKLMPLPGVKPDPADPVGMLADDKGFLLGYARMEAENLATFCLSRSTDGHKWDPPVVLAAPMSYELITPFTNLRSAGSMVAFGYTAGTGRWPYGETTAHVLLSRDGGKTFERIDVGERFSFGSLIPVTALDPKGDRVGWAAVALVPTTDPARIANAPPAEFLGDAYLVFASSPPVPSIIGPIDPNTKRHIEELITKLGSPDYKQREQATADLHKFAEAAAPFLEKAVDNSDLEVATRARLLLKDVYPAWLKSDAAKPETR